MAGFSNVQGLIAQLSTPEGIICGMNGGSFKLEKGAMLGIVDESGCGKSGTVSSVLQLVFSSPNPLFTVGQQFVKPIIVRTEVNYCSGISFPVIL